MAKILNSGLPAGSRGLWWFAQGLENLGTAATGDATLPTESGQAAALTGGQIVMDNDLDKVQLSSDTSLLCPTTAITVMFGQRHTDTNLRDAGGFGFHTNLDTTGRVGTYLPLSDGKIYWDFGGAGEGTTRKSMSYSKDTTLHVWGFTVGARGMEIWQDGVVIGSNAATPTRTANTDAFFIGRYAGGIADRVEIPWFFIHETQLSTTLIEDISADPEAELTEDAGGAALPAIAMYHRRMRG